MNFNFGYFLNILMPTKRMYISREDFLDSIYTPIIEKYDLKDKNGEPYLITRELTSNLFRCKCNLPIVLSRGFEKADKEKELFYDNFKSGLLRLYSEDILFNKTSSLVQNIIKNKPFSNQITDKFRNALIRKDEFEILWFLFKTLGSMENRGNNIPIRKQGRPSKNTQLENFFYLSEETKINEYRRMVNLFSKEKPSISYAEFRYFLDALAYVDDITTTTQKKKFYLISYR